MRATLKTFICVLLGVGIAGCSDGGAPQADGGVAIGIEALTFAGVTDARFQLTVKNLSGETVWTREVRSSSFGDGAGSVSFVGTCDASDNDNTVTIELLDLYEGVGGTTPIAASSYKNPGPLSRTITCAPNADTAVGFDLTILRSANQGFFDVAVEFDDIFCSAKVDCLDDQGQTLKLLHKADGTRGDSVVLALACTAGTEVGVDTVLSMSTVRVTCGGNSVVVDPSKGPGNLTDGAGIAESGGDILFGAATYRGVDQLGYATRYWNVVLGMNAVANCHLDATATASDGALANFTTPAKGSYPFITFSVDLTGVGGARICTHHAVDTGAGVVTAYASPGDTEQFDVSYGASGVDVRVPPPPTEKLVFVTSSTVTGSMGGVAGANARCQSLANTAGIGTSAGHTYKAWISDSTNQPVNTFTHSLVPYKRTDGVAIATGWAALISGSLAAPLNRDENGATQSGFAWTGTLQAGTRAFPTTSGYCVNWTSNSSNAPDNGTQGDISSTANWFGAWNGGNICNTSARLYCFEQ